MRFFLSNNNEPVDPNDPTWDDPLPLSRFGGQPSNGHKPEAGLTYGEYFTAVKSFVDGIPGGFGVDASVTPDRLSVYLEKHGAFYHPSRIAVLEGNRLVEYVLNVAVSEVGKKHLENEFNNLNMLEKKYGYPYLPGVFACREVAVDASRTVGMFMGEWFGSHHEFHVSEKGRPGSSGIRVWNPNDDDRYLTVEEARAVFEQAAAILTACYDIQTFEQVSAWHHAAGDFVINPDGLSGLSVKLVTVRRYAPLMAVVEASAEAVLNGLLLFLLNLSIRMRLDRLDGVGDIRWIDAFALEGTLTGFLIGLEIQSKAERLPQGFIDYFKSFLLEIPAGEMQDLFAGVAGRLNPESPDTHIVQTHLAGHAHSFYKCIKTLF